MRVVEQNAVSDKRAGAVLAPATTTSSSSAAATLLLDAERIVVQRYCYTGRETRLWRYG